MLYTTIYTVESEWNDIITQSPSEPNWKTSLGLEYTINPIINENIGNFYLKIDVQVAEPPEAPI